MMSIRKILTDQIQKLKVEGSFTQNISWTLSGTSLGFAMQLLFSPILSRIYSPEAYGEFAIYNIIVTNLVSFSTLSYPDSLITSKSTRDFKNMSILILFLTLSVLVIVSMTYFPFQGYWANFFPKLVNIDWMPIVLIMAVLSNINDILVKWNIVNKQFKKNFKSNVPSQIFAKSYAILYGLYKSPDGLGLISSEVVRSLVAGYLLAKKGTTDIRMRFPTINKESIRAIWSIAKEYKNYPRYIWPANWMNMFSNQLPILFFTLIFTPYEIGAYAFANSMVAIPGKLIGNAVRPVFFQKSQEILKESSRDQLRTFCQKVASILTLIGLPFFLVLFLTGELLFSFTFGNEWALAGKIAAYMAIIQIFAFSASPISSIFYTLKREKTLLLFQSFLFGIRALSLSISYFLDYDFLQTVFSYSIFTAFAYFVLHVTIFRLQK